MSHENIELVRQAYEGFARGVGYLRDGRREEWAADPLWSIYDPAVVLEEIPEIPDTDLYHGVAGLQAWVEAGFELFEDVTWDLREISERGDHVLVEAGGLFRGRGGAEVRVTAFHVFTCRNGRILRIRGFLDRDQAEAAAS